MERDILQPLAAARKADGLLVLPSEVMGLELHARGASVRLVDPQSGRTLPIPDELGQLAEAARERAERERERAEAAEAEVGRLRAELARIKRSRRG